MSHVFVSYVRNNKRGVQRLRDDLAENGVRVWLDREDIAPGSDWRQAIRRAIQKGAFFIACFSKQCNEREKSYMNEELALAIDELRQRPTDKIWFIPVKLNRCEIPDWDIGGGRTLQHLQYVDLYKHRNDGIKRIVDTVKSPLEDALDISKQTIVYEGDWNRTKRIVDYMNQLLKTRKRLGSMTIRHWGAVSSLSNTSRPDDTDLRRQTGELLEEERELLIMLFRKGTELKVMTPLYRSSETTEERWLRKICNLLDFFNEVLRADDESIKRCKIAISSGIGRNLLIFGGNTMFEGYVTGPSSSLGLTYEYSDETYISQQIIHFDNLFEDARLNTIRNFGQSINSRMTGEKVMLEAVIKAVEKAESVRPDSSVISLVNTEKETI